MESGFDKNTAARGATTLIFGKFFANEILISHIAVESSYEKTEKLLRLKNKPSTLLPMSGPTTTGVIKAISDREMGIPHVISIIGRVTSSLRV